MAQQPLSNRQHVNILALPSQTMMIALLIIFVLIAALITINFNVPAFLFLLLAALMVLIALRGLLSWPDRRRHALRLAPPQGLANLESAIVDLSREIQLPRVPQLLVTPDAIDIHTFGSFRRWYIAVGEERGQALDQLIDDPRQRPIVEAAILHELYHFKHRDNIWIELARSFLFRGGLLILWFGLLLFGVFALSFLARQTFFTLYSPNQLGVIFDRLVPGSGADLATSLFGSQQEWEQLREKAQHTNFGVAMFSIILNTLPFAVFAAILLPTLWRALLLLREVYADAGTARTQGRISPLVNAVIYAGQSATTADSENQGQVSTGILLLRDWWLGIYRRFRRASLEPLKRLDYLHHPELLYEGWWSSGLLIGLFVVVTNMLLSGTSALFFIGSWPLHFPVLVAALLLCFSTVLPIVMGANMANRVAYSVSVIMGMHTIVIVISLMLVILSAFFAPVALTNGLEFVVRGMVWYTNIANDTVVQDPRAFATEATIINLLQIPIMLVMLLLSLAAHIQITRRLLTWYSFPQAKQRLVPLIQRSIWLQLAVVGFVLLPPLTDLVLLRGIQSLASPWYWLFSTLTLGVAGVVVIRLLLWDRAYAGRCPSCESAIAGAYRLGRRCPTCDHLLHHWLISEYDTEPN